MTYIPAICCSCLQSNQRFCNITHSTHQTTSQSRLSPNGQQKGMMHLCLHRNKLEKSDQGRSDKGVCKDIVHPLIGIPYPSMKALEVEICAVASKITAASSYCLPHTGPKIINYIPVSRRSQSARSKERLRRGGLTLGNLYTAKTLGLLQPRFRLSELHQCNQGVLPKVVLESSSRSFFSLTSLIFQKICLATFLALLSQPCNHLGNYPGTTV